MHPQLCLHIYCVCAHMQTRKHIGCVMSCTAVCTMWVSFSVILHHTPKSQSRKQTGSGCHNIYLFEPWQGCSEKRQLNFICVKKCVDMECPPKVHMLTSCSLAYGAGGIWWWGEWWLSSANKRKFSVYACVCVSSVCLSLVHHDVAASWTTGPSYSML